MEMLKFVIEDRGTFSEKRKTENLNISCAPSPPKREISLIWLLFHPINFYNLNVLSHQPLHPPPSTSKNKCWIWIRKLFKIHFLESLKIELYDLYFRCNSYMIIFLKNKDCIKKYEHNALGTERITEKTDHV